jgi:hypothetical protein
MGFGKKTDLAEIPAVPLSSSITLGKLVNHSVPENAHLENGDNSTYFTELKGQ